jgi:MFS family permease
VTYGVFFRNRRAFLAILVPFIACIFLLYFGPILSNQVVSMGLPEGLSGYALAACWSLYAVGCFIAGYLCRYMARRTLVLFSILLCSIALVFVGPSYILHLPEQIWLMFVGLGLLGLGIAGITVPVLPELIESV